MINYVIASYSGVIGNREEDKEAEYSLQYNLTCLSDILLKKKTYGLQNLIRQVTIVCPTPRAETSMLATHPPQEDSNPAEECVSAGYPNYYRKEYWTQQFATLHPEVKIVFMDYVGENKHASYDQFIQAYVAYPDFDYYILMEDDYCIHPQCTSFDTEMVDMFSKNLGKTGYLCSYAAHLGHPFHAAISNGMISGESFKLLGPDILNKFYNTKAKWPQVQFSLLFTNIGVPLADMLKHYQAPFYRSYDDVKMYYNPHNIANVSFTPVQFLYGDVDVRDRI
jgi:hypothetical protein